MDETTRAIIERILVKFDTPQPVPGGHLCSVFYDCSRLTSPDLARLAAEAVGHLGEGIFDMSIGLAYRGILFAAAVAGGRQVGILQTDGEIFGPSVSGKKVVVVDDVVYSGDHLAQAEKKINAAGGEVVGYACIVDRSKGRPLKLGKPVWSAFQTIMA